MPNMVGLATKLQPSLPIARDCRDISRRFHEQSIRSICRNTRRLLKGIGACNQLLLTKFAASKKKGETAVQANVRFSLVNRKKGIFNSRYVGSLCCEAISAFGQRYVARIIPRWN